MERICGNCTMCCKLLGIEELKKPPNVWCTLCAIGKGCTVYGSHPASCREFVCLWLQGAGPDSMRPDKSKVVFFLPEADPHVMVATVDVNTPDAWQQGAAAAAIALWHQVDHDNVVVIVVGQKVQLRGRNPEALARVEGSVKLHKSWT